MTKIPAAIVLISDLFLAVACVSDESGHDNSGQMARKTVDALDQVTASLRGEIVSNVSYELFIDLAGSEDRFAGEALIEFDISDLNGDLTLDFGGGAVQDLRINGSDIHADYNGLFLRLPADKLLSGSNSMVVGFEHPYSEDGTGLHRFVDPEDGHTYLYTYLWPYYANRLFPSFDQPNLKANIGLTVSAPGSWTVISTSHGDYEPENADTNIWRFSQTPKLSTYVFALHAGPYKVWEDTADGVPIRLFARQSLADFVAVEEWLETTRRGLRYFDNYFMIPYPFEKYDQLIVPDFVIGAMENIAAVTFSEQFVQRQQSTSAQRESRTGTILHEMAHMWFGNLVTHDWWNGLWLNESFATQMAVLATLETTDFDDAWHRFLIAGKRTAYARDNQVTTHPIEIPVSSTADFFTVFDAITYQKGSSVLKQLAHYTGAESYRRGVSAYLRKNSFATTELADFIGHQQASSGLDLARWTNDWLYQPGFNMLQSRIDCAFDSLSSVQILQTATDDHPYLRSHVVDLALYDVDTHGNVTLTEVLPVTIDGAVTTVEFQGAQACPEIANPNHNDWTYAKIKLDKRQLETLVAHIGAIPDSMDRSIFLNAIYDAALVGEISIADYIDVSTKLAATEDNNRVQQQISQSLLTATNLLRRMRPESNSALARIVPEIEELALNKARTASSFDLRRQWLETFIGIASTKQALATVSDLLGGVRSLPAIEITADIRWRLLIALSRNGFDNIDELLASDASLDKSDFAAKRFLTASAARPDANSKSRWVAELQHPESITGLAKQRAVMVGLFPSNQTALQLEQLPTILDALPALSQAADPYFVASYVRLLVTPMCRAESVSMLRDALSRLHDELSTVALQFLREAHQADSECLALRDYQ